MNIALGFKILRIAFPYVLSGIIAFGTAWKIQGVRIDGLKTELKQARTELAVCQDANESVQKTIELLKAEVENANKTCSQRLSSKDALIKKLRHIETLIGKKTATDMDKAKIIQHGTSGEVCGVKNEKIDNFTDNFDDDAVLRELNSMFINKSNR